MIPRLPVRFVRRLFQLLYGPLAPYYDLISRTFFLGQWAHWQKSVLPFATGRILEVGAGTGALMEAAHGDGRDWTALEPSPDMIRQIRKRPAFDRASKILVRGFVQNLPFQDGCFDTIVSTFPTEYVFDPSSLAELGRVTRRDGTILVVPGAVLLPTGFLGRLFDSIQKFVEGEVAEQVILPGPAGFRWIQRWTASPRGRSLLLIGRRDGSALPSSDLRR